jgi:DNA-binding FadR family transcriptional regulator
MSMIRRCLQGARVSKADVSDTQKMFHSWLRLSSGNRMLRPTIAGMYSGYAFQHQKAKIRSNITNRTLSFRRAF